MDNHKSLATKVKRFEAIMGDFDAVAAGSSVGVGKLHVGEGNQFLEKISALVTVDAETDLLTLTPFWQVSMDGSTWIDVVHGPENAAGVALATGTGGADAPKSKVYGAPAAVEAFRWARLAIRVGGATGTTSDTYSVSYTARAESGASF